jgi:PhnB protein
MDINTYLMFDGTCAEAIRFYEKVLGGKIVMMMSFGEMPGDMAMSPEAKKRIAHARLQVGDKFLMASDCPPGRSETAKGFHVNVSVTEPAEADRLFKELSADGSITMPIQ